MLVVLAIITVVFFVILIGMMYGQLMRAGGGAISGIPILAGAGRGGTATGGQPAKGLAYRSYEGDIAAVDTLTSLTAFGGNTVSTQVPKGALLLNSMDIGVSFDFGATLGSFRGHVQVQLIGQGFKNSPHQFGGPAVSCQGLTTTSGAGVAMTNANVRYEGLNIECVEGGDASIQAVLIGEDPGDATVCVTLGYVLA